MVAAGLSRLRQAGVNHLTVMGLVNPRANPRDIRQLIPEGFPNLGDPFFNEADTLLRLALRHAGMLVPMLDTRCLDGEVPDLLQGWLDKGFKGLKGLYLADERNDLKLAGVPAVFGISLRQYHRREWEIFAFAEANDLPVVYHMDARLYGDVMRAMLDDFPRLRINFPHFGIGRKAFAPILDRYPNVYTDIAYMLPHISANPAGYRDFICHYPDRVCFGSDALLYQPEIVLDYIDLVRSLKLPEEVEQGIFSENPRRFLGKALEPRQERP
ncbi:amidohydrolase family protein [Geothermobacter ehrlichii]|uniref:Amidohydrolase family protein n=2 Tax=Geothermobacter ehrlichii TaxID=213224 RepID=A0A5D3WMH1_9BACT|nr:amidohydrolase family protein [Geothermobacter ehrlichii]